MQKDKKLQNRIIAREQLYLNRMQLFFYITIQGRADKTSRKELAPKNRNDSPEIRIRGVRNPVKTIEFTGF